MSKRVQKKRGFTLVEVMVVVMILSILLSVATPQFVRANLKAREAQLKADLKVVRDALENAANDIGTYPNPADLDNTVPDTLSGWYGEFQGNVGWSQRTFTLSQWKGPYIKKFPTANPINGAPYMWDAGPLYATHAFHCTVNATSTEGSNYRSW
jgi:prepilin-type N-terminal cleavage/methylation domain-containing protein